METLQLGQLVTIGGKYADALGYKHLVGSLAQVIRFRSALVEVSIILPAQLTYINQVYDIHPEDLLPTQSDEEKKFVIVSFDTDAIFHTKNEALYHFVKIFFQHHFSLRKRHMASIEAPLSKVIEECTERYRNDFKVIDLDEEGNLAADILRSAYNNHLKDPQQLIEDVKKFFEAIGYDSQITISKKNV